MSSAASFPSGDWYGYYTYSNRTDRHAMELFIRFNKGLMTAHGADPVGEFTCRGTYDPDTRSCAWIKDYVAYESVQYEGRREGRGIRGTWKLTGSQGGFVIWPVGQGGEATHASRKERSAVGAVAS